MLKRASSCVASFPSRTVLFSGWVGVSVGALVLAGWTADIDPLKRVFPAFVSMNPLTAVCFLAAASGLLLLRQESPSRGRRIRAAVCAAVPMACGGLVLLRYLTGWDAGIDRLLFSSALESEGPNVANAMALHTALLFLLSGGALQLVAFGVGRRAAVVSQSLAVATTALALLVLVGYVYQASPFLAVGPSIPMVLNTAAAFFLIGLGVFFLRPRHGLASVIMADTVGGLLLRRLLPGSLLLPVVVGGLLLLGEWKGIYDPEFVFSLAIVGIMGFLSVMIWTCAAPLNAVENALREARDDLERRVAERTAELSEEREHLNVVLRNARSHIVACDTQGRLALDNRAACVRADRSPVSLPPDEWTGFFDYHSPDDRRPLTLEELPLKRALSGELVRSEEFIRPDGRGGFRTLTVTAQPIADPRGHPLGAVSFAHDITEQKWIDSQLQRSQRLESIGTLAGGIAHDLNNVLVPVLMGIQTLQEDKIDEDTREVLETVESSTRRGVDIVKQILSFARGGSGEKVELDLKTVIGEHVTMIRETFPPSIRIEADIDEDLLIVNGDNTQLHQVLMNLCLNARDAMAEGGVLSIVAKNQVVGEEDPLRHGGVAAGPYVEIAVCDTGPGIPRELIERVFDPFFTTKEPGKGPGLGLSTMVGIVRDHGGFWQVDSEPGAGAVFRVFFPALRECPLPVAPRRRRPRLKGAGQCVLLVDDDAAVLAVTRGLLERHDYRVVTAENGCEAVDCFDGDPDAIDLVMIDMSMPVMDGATAIRALRERSATLPIVAVSGLPENRDEAEKASGGTAYFLLKPYTIGVVLETVRRAAGTSGRLDEPDLLGRH